MSLEAATGPLRGIKVVEVAAWAAGPMAGGILADWGADVIKIEPPDGDPYRALNIQPGKRPEGMINHNFFVANRNKRSISIDLKNEHGRRLADKLISNADVFLTNVRRQALERLNLHYDHLHRQFPRLVYCHLTGYGIKGPDVDRPAYDIWSVLRPRRRRRDLVDGRRRPVDAHWRLRRLLHRVCVGQRGVCRAGRTPGHRRGPTGFNLAAAHRSVLRRPQLQPGVVRLPALGPEDPEPELQSDD